MILKALEKGVSNQRIVLLRIGVEQNVPKRGSVWALHFQDTSPTAGVVGGHKFSQTVPVARSPRDYELAVGGEFKEGAVGEVGAGALDLQRRGDVVRGGDHGWAGGKAGGDMRRL